MIYLTEALNDRELIRLFGGLAVLAPIPHGDFCFFGKDVGKKDGADNNIRICGERKRTGDLINCVTYSGRYLQQWRKAKEAGFERQFLVVEDDPPTRPSEDGLLEVRKGTEWTPYEPRIMYRRIAMYLHELANYLQVQIIKSRGAWETVCQVVALYQMYQTPPEEHDSLKQFYVQPQPALQLYGEPSLLRRMAKELPGIGWIRSEAVEKAMGTVERMATATLEQWEAVPGVGEKIARDAYEGIRKEV